MSPPATRNQHGQPASFPRCETPGSLCKETSLEEDRAGQNSTVFGASGLAKLRCIVLDAVPAYMYPGRVIERRTCLAETKGAPPKGALFERRGVELGGL